MKRILYCLLLLPFFSCQEEVFLDLQKKESIPIIEGIWTNVGGLNQVKISLSKDYYSEGPGEVVDNAEVYVVNSGNGFRYNFRFSEDVSRYIPVNNLGGRIEEKYELHVLMGENHYISSGTLLAPPKLDSITYAFKEERIFRDEGYYLTLYGDIPFTTDNNYRVRLVRNDTLLNRRSDYLLFDDTFGTSILNRGFELSGFRFKENDKVRIELYRLNQDAFDYLNQLVNLLFNDGGLFSPPPENPKTNIRILEGGGEVLGYFLVSPVLTETVVIQPE
ncbi:hypothetical protein P872_19875 [Rhodonellum psychrophilum GCM71 = DSM 17998]|uniref:DUF4249 domain-containing protein n=2 Tax=Rhodonellum TaxID=336827 RepID=U5BY90_9BACT|nr:MULTISPECIES: DUF4249 family protein [Rhodonellum]ERM81616.1 hypothetical protein P872_19875 [Rhodonellum psychrophilum GCM71 = DSM 17998]MDO9552918.1 DUF4249 family protein [Rhodonellum sp.]